MIKYNSILRIGIFKHQQQQQIILDKSAMILFTFFIALITADTFATPNQNQISSSNFAKSPITLNQISRQSYQITNSEIKLRILVQSDEQEHREEQNEDPFQKLREGLDNWPEKPHQRLRTNSQTQLVDHLNQKNQAHGKQMKEKQVIFDEDELLKEAGLIEQEVIPETITTEDKAQSTPSSDKIVIYLAILILIAVILIKFIKERCLQHQARIQSHQEEAESLSSL